jgi:hypothetical protein
MNKTLTIALALTFVLSAAIAYAAQTPPATVTISAAKAKQPPVVFAHDKHMTRAKNCETCHHKNKGLTKENAKDVQKCSSCHLDPKDPKAPSMREMSLTKNPFHITCVNCHKAATPKKGPVACTGCHVKK